MDITQTHFRSCVGLGAGVWLLVHPTALAFDLSSAHFFTTVCTHFGLPHPTIAHLSWCQCGHTIDDLCAHLLQCPCGNECTTTLDTFWGIVATIALESKAHI